MSFSRLFQPRNGVFRLIDEEPEKADAPGAAVLTETNGCVTMDHIRFGYLPGQTIIHDLSLKAPGGCTVAIVGHTGAGKTTLINLLMRFYDPQSGVIAVDGKNIQELTRKSLRLSYAMVLQDTWLFSGTIFENIAYGRPDATMEEVIAAAKAAHIHSYITRLPDGYNTLINEGRSEHFSRPKAADDHRTRHAAGCQNADFRRSDLQRGYPNGNENPGCYAGTDEGENCFVIAHRLSTIQNADTILVVDGGDIVEQGTHRELMAKNGYYAALYNAQFQ